MRYLKTKSSPFKLLCRICKASILEHAWYLNIQMAIVSDNLFTRLCSRKTTISHIGLDIWHHLRSWMEFTWILDNFYVLEIWRTKRNVIVVFPFSVFMHVSSRISDNTILQIRVAMYEILIFFLLLNCPNFSTTTLRNGTNYNSLILSFSCKVTRSYGYINLCFVQNWMYLARVNLSSYMNLRQSVFHVISFLLILGFGLSSFNNEQ